MNVIMWGTFDKSRPRNRLTIEACQKAGIDVQIQHSPVWQGIEDKSQVSSFWDRLKIIVRLVFAYPLLVIRYMFAQDHEVVFVGYLGHLDVLVLWPFARLRGKPIVWDAFLSLYDTVVNDRQLLGPRHPLARLLLNLEKLACHAADTVVLDTQPHAALFQELYRLPAEKFEVVPVGAERVFYRPVRGKARPTPRRKTVLFYGQFIPLQGVETIVAAAKLCCDDNICWHLVGQGQESPKIDALIKNEGLENVIRTPWLAYDALVEEIGSADICLGIFGESDKADRVVPNKVFQVLAAEKPLITRQSQGMSWLLGNSVPNNVLLVPPGDPEALCKAVLTVIEKESGSSDKDIAEFESVCAKFSISQLGTMWSQILQRAKKTKSTVKQ